MRRHPLAGRPPRLLGGILVAGLLVGCGAAGPVPIGTPPTAIAVTIASAPGETLAFEPAQITVRASGPITLTFRNGSTLPHNLVFTAGLSAATGMIVEPGTSEQLLLVPTAPGTYPFVCTIHEGMAGTFIVQASASGDRTVAVLGARP